MPAGGVSHSQWERVFSPPQMKPLPFPLPLQTASVANCTSARQQLWNVYRWRGGKGWQQPRGSFITKRTSAAFIPPFRLGDSSNSSSSIFLPFPWIFMHMAVTNITAKIYIWYWKFRSGVSQRLCGPVSRSWQGWHFVLFRAYRCINAR